MEKYIPRSSADLFQRSGYDDQLAMMGLVRATSWGFTIDVNNKSPMLAIGKDYQGLPNAFSRAAVNAGETGKYQSLTGNAIVYIRMPDHSVVIATNERDGPPQWEGYSTGIGGLTGAEGPALTSAKEMSEEVGIVIQRDHNNYSLLCPSGRGCISKLEKFNQIETVREKLGLQGLIGVENIEVRELFGPRHSDVEFRVDGEVKQKFRAHAFAEADYVGRDKVGDTMTMQRYFLIDLADQGLSMDDVLFVNPDQFPAPVANADFDTLVKRHVQADGSVTMAMANLSCVLQAENRQWAHPKEMLKQSGLVL